MSTLAAGALAVGVAIAGWYRVLLTLTGARTESWAMADFRTLYAAARMVIEGDGGHLYDIDRLADYQARLDPLVAATISYLNPPFFAVLLAPLGTLDLSNAYRIWAALMLVALVATSVLIGRLTRKASAARRAALIAAMWLTYATAFSIELGQFSMLLVASWTAGFVALRAGRDRLAAFALAPLLIKPELLIPLFLVLLRTRRRAAAWLAGITVGAVLASLAVVGVSGLWEYPAFIIWNAGVEEHGSSLTGMFGWNGLVASAMGIGALATVLTIPLMLATAAIVPWAWGRRWPLDDEDLAPRWLLLTVATLLADPNLFLQDMPLLFPPMLFALTVGSPGRLLPALALLAWAFAALGYVPGDSGVPLLHLTMVAIFVRQLWVVAGDRLPRLVQRPRELGSTGPAGGAG